ncbi:hypothetical protein [Pararhodobacter aggregans]|uniref:Tricarboxylate transporter n=1 Tax=Pararhodobacter aggregans TaxID=404875 RepID=A0A2T7ULW3_9RHOB|nr:hypothetical protein [Pararhodobacter aggregans]PTW99052.1 tripartite-type tricarboxylate transporter receptor subunit TctC [Pararhodobacter aggregans]PVE45611.1 hypothetical protein DDE23_20315 [Pararhodobacter aggregans]
MPRTTVLAGLAALTLGAPPALAEDRYEGETIRIVINLGAGGSTGVMAQLFANHWADHIPGNPDFIVQPVTGGAQMAGIIEARNARPDGLTLAWVSWSGPTRAIGPASQNVDWSDFEVIAGMGVPTMAYMRNDVGGATVTGPADLPGLSGLQLGGYRPGSYLDLIGRMSLDLLGIEYGYTTGFGDGSSIVAALQRDEVNFHVTPAGNYFGGIEDNVVGAGIGLPLWYYELAGPDGQPVGLEGFGDMPSFRSVVEDLTGAPPEGPLYDAIEWLNQGMAGTTWLIAAPRGVDAETLALLRESFAATVEEPAFREAATATAGSVPVFTGPAQMETMIDGLRAVDPAIAETVTSYIASGTQ